jgi:hypothetical protein
METIEDLHAVILFMIWGDFKWLIWNIYSTKLKGKL